MKVWYAMLGLILLLALAASAASYAHGALLAFMAGWCTAGLLATWLAGDAEKRRRK